MVKGAWVSNAERTMMRAVIGVAPEMSPLMSIPPIREMEMIQVEGVDIQSSPPKSKHS